MWPDWLYPTLLIGKTDTETGIDERIAFSGCSFIFPLWTIIIYSRHCKQIACALDWLMGLFLQEIQKKKHKLTPRVTQLLNSECDGHSDIIMHIYNTRIKSVGGYGRVSGLLQSIILSGYVIFRQRVSRTVLLCDNDSYFHLFNWCIKRLRINFQFCNYCI